MSLRFSTVSTRISLLTMSSSSSRVSSKLLKVIGDDSPRRAGCHLCERHDRSRAADEHVEPELVHLGHERSERRPDELAARADRCGMDAVSAEEASGQADRAELEAARGERLASFSDQQLGRTAPDVDEHQPLVVDRHGLQHPEVDEAGLLDAGDHLDLDAGLVVRASHECIVVLGLPHRARGDRTNRGAFGLCHPPHVGQGTDATFHRVGVEHLHVPGTGTEAHHLPLSRDDLEAAVRRDACDHEVDRVRADVDRREHRVGLDRHLDRHLVRHVVAHRADATLRS